MGSATAAADATVDRHGTRRSLDENATATTTVTHGSGSEVSVGMVVGIAVAVGVVVGIIVGLFVAYRYRKKRAAQQASETAELAQLTRREAFSDNREMWDGVAPLSQAGATGTTDGVLVQVDKSRGVRLTHVPRS